MPTRTVAVKVVVVGERTAPATIEMMFVRVPLGKARSFKRAVTCHVERLSGWKIETIEPGFGLVVSCRKTRYASQEVERFVNWVLKTALDCGGIVRFSAGSKSG